MRSYASALNSRSTSPMANTSAATSTANIVIDINHPYYLSSSDHPGLSLVSEQLTDQNYHQWSRSVQITLSAKLKLGFIDGTQVKPASNSPQLSLWMRSDDLVISWLLNSISSEIRKSVVSIFHTFKQIWEDLATRFAQSNVPRLFNLRKELASLTQGTKSIIAYFTQFRGLIDELYSLSPIPKCICAASNCACGKVMKLEQYEKITKLSQFLMGLNTIFTNTRGQILLMHPLPDINYAYSMLLQEENQRDISTVGIMTESLAMNVRLKSNSNFKPKTVKKPADSSLMCDYYNLTRHTRDKCYPDWNRLYGKPKPKPINATNKRFQPAANITQSVSSSGPLTQSDNLSNVQSAVNFVPSVPLMSDQQCQQIINMLQAKMSGTTPSNSWMSANTISHTPSTSQVTSMAGACHDEEEEDW
ncbi:uncharacterized protein LOC141708419 [Apium graveolens]|uniref:uncharacterized protein LOC141708419 n=1 Tax=Apium graveolens TaxID=4045 RepID=UPI003D78B902